MARYVTFSIPNSEAGIWDKFMAIAKREGKPASRLLLEVIEEYISKHSEGNPVIPITKWVDDPDTVVFPTLGERVRREKLLKMDEKMLYILSRNAEEYASEAKILLYDLQKHRQHSNIGLKLDTCPYCKNDDQQPP